MPNVKTEPRLLSAVRDVVHDYANLVSSGEMAVSGQHLGQRLTPPINSHIGDAFLLNCRKMSDFFIPRPSAKPGDVFASDFVRAAPSFQLPAWKSWQAVMDKQLMHVTLERSKEWSGHTENPQFLSEFKQAWKLFLTHLSEAYKSEFAQQIEARLLGDGFTGLDLS